MKRKMNLLNPTSQPVPPGEPRRAPELSDEAIDAFLDGRDRAQVLREPSVILELYRKLAERALQAEMAYHLDHCEDPNTRNGHNRKTVHTEHGSMLLAVPRDRQGSFRPQLIEPWCRRLEGFDQLVLSLFSSGLSMREIRDQLAARYDVDVSPELISKITDEVHEELREWQDRPLNEVYALLFLDAIWVKIRQDGAVTNKPVFLALGVDCSGRKQLLGLWIQQQEGAKFWLKVLKELQLRGVKDVLIAVTDALNGFPAAIEAVFPQALVQTCVVHLLRNSLLQVCYQERQQLSRSLKQIYRADSAVAGLQALEAFEDSELGRKYPAIGRLWHRHWEQVEPFFSFTEPVRKAVYTTNAIESLNSCVRRAVVVRGHFPSDKAASKLIYMALRKVERKWKRPPPYWHQARREFAILFEDRFQVVPR